VALAVLELAARAAAGGARVLVVDAGRTLALHRAFGAVSRPGFVECLARTLPLLGVVQRAGVPRVLLLAHGAGRRPEWTQLDRMLEEARPHFDLVVLAVAPDAPDDVGSILAGRPMDGWWASPGGRHVRGVAWIEKRIGIAFHDMTLRAGDQASPEMLRARVSELEQTVSPGPAPAPNAAPVAAPVSEHANGSAVEVPAMAPRPILEPDSRVRERLRFLAWMRRVQADARER
jgi:hypothetical protein